MSQHLHPGCISHICDMDRRKAQTLQPIRQEGWPKTVDPMLVKWLESASHPESNASHHNSNASYANIARQMTGDDFPLPHHQPHQLRPHSHAHPHSRSHSHARSQSNYYHYTMVNQPSEHLNGYYNLPHLEATLAPSGLTRHQPLPPAETPVQEEYPRLDFLSMMQACSELGMNLDSSPPVPKQRNYTISRADDGSLFKVSLPHSRYINKEYHDPMHSLILYPNDVVWVTETSRRDRSMFTVFFNNQRHEIPQSITSPPHPTI